MLLSLVWLSCNGLWVLVAGVFAGMDSAKMMNCGENEDEDKDEDR